MSIHQNIEINPLVCKGKTYYIIPVENTTCYNLHL